MFRAINCWSTLYLHMDVWVGVNSNVLYFPLNFRAFHIPLKLALKQLKVLEIWSSFDQSGCKNFAI